MCNLFTVATGNATTSPVVTQDDVHDLITASINGDLNTVESQLKLKYHSWDIDRAFKAAFQVRESVSLQSSQAYITALQSEQTEALQVAYQKTLKAAQLSHVLEALFKKSTTTSQVFEDACKTGNKAMIRFFLNHDYSEDFRSSPVSHKHIIVARDAGHRKIALTLQKHLADKGYGYANAIEI